jgi:hypothetical protein
MNQQARRDEMYRKLMQEWIPVFVYIERDENRQFGHVNAANTTPDIDRQYDAWSAYVAELAVQCGREFAATSNARGIGHSAMNTAREHARQLLAINPNTLAS